jgi:hypothetical protein
MRHPTQGPHRGDDTRAKWPVSIKPDAKIEGWKRIWAAISDLKFASDAFEWNPAAGNS